MGIKRRNRIGKVSWLHWLPLLCWLFVIFYMSAQPYEKQDIKPWISKNVAEHAIQQHLSSVEINYGGKEISIPKIGVSGFVEFFIRKGAHLVEYMVLGLLICNVLIRVVDKRVWCSMFISLALCFVYASLDEFHQSFSVHRTPLLADVIMDTCGALIGIMLFSFFKILVERRGVAE